MRDIKFRGKTACCQLATAKDVWVYGEVYGIYEEDDTCYIVMKNYFKQGESKNLLVKKNTVGQFTGLYDKNGKEIYEGDIIEYKADGEIIYKGTVEYSEKYAQYVLVDTLTVKDEFEPLGEYNIEVFEVIGNIYDNPELLKEENK